MTSNLRVGSCNPSTTCVLNSMFRLSQDAAEGRQSINPLDEDWIGRVASISRCVASAILYMYVLCAVTFLALGSQW